MRGLATQPISDQAVYRQTRAFLVTTLSVGLDRGAGAAAPLDGGGRGTPRCRSGHDGRPRFLGLDQVVVQVWALRDSPGAGSQVRVVEQRGFGHF